MSTELRVVLTTFPGIEKAREVVRELVESQLIACGNLLPGAVSLYIYDGKFCEDEEVVAILKTRKEKLTELEARLLELHPYETPEFVVLPIDQTSVGYGKWVTDQTR